MTTFDEREQAFEAKFAHDEEVQFRIQARCNKMLGLWAAELLGKTGSAAEEYAISVISADLEEAGHEDLLRKLVSDLGSKASEAEIREKLDTLTAAAKAEFLEEAD